MRWKSLPDLRWFLLLQVVAVVGRIGSGKSSLIQALLGNMVRHRGAVQVGRGGCAVAFVKCMRMAGYLGTVLPWIPSHACPRGRHPSFPPMSLLLRARTPKPSAEPSTPPQPCPHPPPRMIPTNTRHPAPTLPLPIPSPPAPPPTAAPAGLQPRLLRAPEPVAPEPQHPGVSAVRHAVRREALQRRHRGVRADHGPGHPAAGRRHKVGCGPPPLAHS